MKKKNIILIATGLVMCFTSCKKKGCTDPSSLNYDPEAQTDDGSCEYANTPNYTVPSTYTFTDASGNNTVSYGGQTARMDMLSEMVTYLKTANNDNTVTLDAQKLKEMYDNSYTGWSDQNLVGNGKQLKSKK